jgi:3'-phosphoadenosine 5'-phosphosulfate sulfotransferase (PAPS reductase)/FAD synthetase
MTTVLSFSGGKDSLACLYLARPAWDEMTVVWVNTGDAFPETIAQMEEVRAMVPHFLEVNSDQPAQQARCGYPSDVVPVWDTPLGRAADASRAFKVQDPFMCCGSNIWAPMMRAVKALGADTVIRGQRLAETKKSQLRHGDVVEGVRYLFPIEDWSDEAVVQFLDDQGVALPEHYAFVNSSLDCQHCTAYLGENQGKFTYMKQRHPALYRDVVQRVAYLVDATQAELGHLKGVLQ